MLLPQTTLDLPSSQQCKGREKRKALGDWREGITGGGGGMEW